MDDFTREEGSNDERNSTEVVLLSSREKSMPLVLLPAFLSIAAFCHWSVLSKTSVYALIRARRLRPVKVGRRTLIPAAECARWLASLPAVHPSGVVKPSNAPIADKDEEV